MRARPRRPCARPPGVGKAQVRVSAFPSAAAGLMPGATRELRARRPDAELTLQVLENGPALEALLAGRIDVGLIVQSPLLPSSAPSGDRVPPGRRRRDDGSPSPPTTRWPRARRSRSRSCATSRGSSPRSAARAPTPTSCSTRSATRAIEPNVRFASDDYQALQGMAASGIGVALIPMLAHRQHPQRRRRPAAARPRARPPDPGGRPHRRAEPAGRAHDRVAAQRVTGARPPARAARGGVTVATDLEQIAAALEARSDEIVDAGVAAIRERIPAYGAMDAARRQDVRAHVVRTRRGSSPPLRGEHGRPRLRRRARRAARAQRHPAAGLPAGLPHLPRRALAGADGDRRGARAVRAGDARGGAAGDGLHRPRGHDARARPTSRRSSCCSPRATVCAATCSTTCSPAARPAPRRALAAARAAGLERRCLLVVALPVDRDDDEFALRARANALAAPLTTALAPLTVVRGGEIVIVRAVRDERFAVKPLLEPVSDGLAVGVGTVQDSLARAARTPTTRRRWRCVPQRRRRLAPGHERLRLPDAARGRHGAADGRPRRSSASCAEDLAKGGALCDTLEAYAAADLNAKEAAERLFIHFNTAHYRLGQDRGADRARHAPARRRGGPGDRDPAGAAMKSRLVEVDGVADQRRRARDGEGTPLLLATGIGAHIDMWEPLVRRIDRPLIAFDAPGTGRSPRRAPLRMSGLAGAGDAAAGHARLRPGRRARLLVRAAGSCRSSRTARPSGCGGSCCARRRRGSARVPPKPVAGLLLATPARYYHPALLRWTVPRIAGGRTRRDPAALREQADARLAHAPSPLGYAFQLYAAAGWSSLPWLHRLRHADAGRRRRRRPRDPARQRAAARAPDSRRAAARRPRRRPPVPARRAGLGRGRDSGVLEQLKQLVGDLVGRPVAVDATQHAAGRGSARRAARCRPRTAAGARRSPPRSRRRGRGPAGAR